MSYIDVNYRKMQEYKFSGQLPKIEQVTYNGTDENEKMSKLQ